MFEVNKFDVIVVTAVGASLLAARNWKKPGTDLIPTIGHSNPVLSYLETFFPPFNLIDRVRGGYAKYGNGFFRVPMFPGHTFITTSNPKHIEEMRRASDDVMSFLGFTNEMLSIAKYSDVQGIEFMEKRSHVVVARNQLTKNLDKLVAPLREEIVFAFDQVIPLVGQEWTTKPAIAITFDLVSRISNRAMLSLPVCRNDEYRSLVVQLTANVIKGSTISNRVPLFLKPLVQRFFIDRTTLNRCTEILEPYIAERENQIDLYGPDYPGRPDDALSWLLEEAEGDERSHRNLTFRVFNLNFASIHTTGMTFLQALYFIAGRSELVKPLREEVETVIRQEGWTKVAFDKMYKLDSLFRDTFDYAGISCFGMTRKILKEYTFSDGTTLPPGTFVTSLRPDMLGPEPRPSFSDILSEDGFSAGGKDEKSIRGMVATSASHTHFGHGRHACPGRFFAALEMKMMMAYILMNYDVKMGGEGGVPDGVWLGTTRIPSPGAKIMFKRRIS